MKLPFTQLRKVANTANEVLKMFLVTSIKKTPKTYYSGPLIKKLLHLF
jgi:hypothetical protein